MTPAVYRLLLACFFCTLWGGAVWAEVKGTPTESLEETAAKVKGAKDASQKVLDNLKEAAVLADKQKKLEERPQDSYEFSGPQSNAESLLAAVEKATKAAADAVGMAGSVAPSSSDEELKEALNTALVKTKELSSKAKEVYAKAKEINAAADPTTEGGSLETLAGDIIRQLKEAEQMAEDTLRAQTEAEGKIAEKIAANAAKITLGNTKGGLQDEETRSDTAAGDTPQGTTNHETERSENKHSDKPNLQDTHNTQEEKNDKPPKPLSSPPHAGREVGTPSADTEDNVVTDTLDASEITAWASSPLLLLLTAAAYAAMC